MEQTYTTLISIDPGISAGAIVIETNNIIEVFKMPRTAIEFNKLLKANIPESSKTICFIERLSLWNSDNSSGKQFRIQKMLAHHEQLKTVLQMNEIDYVSITAQSWQKGLNLVVKGEEKPARKKRYQEVAKAWFSTMTVPIWKADALLIYSFLKLKLKTDIRWITERLGEQLK